MSKRFQKMRKDILASVMVWTLVFTFTVAINAQTKSENTNTPTSTSQSNLPKDEGELISGRMPAPDLIGCITHITVTSGGWWIVDQNCYYTNGTVISRHYAFDPNWTA